MDCVILAQVALKFRFSLYPSLNMSQQTPKPAGPCRVDGPATCPVASRRPVPADFKGTISSGTEPLELVFVGGPWKKTKA